jgi:uncharacterized protein (TIGR03118 family)
MAHHTDPNLDGWGMDTMPHGFVVANPAFGVATFYDANGTVLPKVVTVPPAPSQPLGPVGKPRGAVYNSTSEFMISEDGRSAPALVLFGTRDGTISGWNPAVDPDHAIIMVDNSSELPTAYNQAMYSSLHIAQNRRGQNVLYAADRGHNKIDMFDGQFHFLGSFNDPNVSLQSPGHPGAWQVEDAPNGQLFVLFTMESGPFHPYGGIVDIFDTDGHLLTPNHFAANGLGAGPLEAPWGITQAPIDFGQFSNDILIGNDGGPGYINAFDPVTGASLGHLTHPDGTPIAIPGLWYLTFGGGTPQTGRTDQLFFVAGPSLEHNTGQGLFGRIIAAGRPGEPGGVSAPSSHGADSIAASVSLALEPQPASATKLGPLASSLLEMGQPSVPAAPLPGPVTPTAQPVSPNAGLPTAGGSSVVHAGATDVVFAASHTAATDDGVWLFAPLSPHNLDTI